MIKSYNAISLPPNGSKSLKGGSTKPWLINVRTEKGIKPYVVKLFTKAHINDYAAVAKEIFASVIAEALDLQCPKPAFIDLNETFIKTLTIEEQQDLETRDSRIKFGCEYIEGSVAYNEVLSRSILDRYNLENIYAFDNLIRNMDRKPSKPNILISNNNFHLIDHELSLPINHQTLREFDSENWTYNFKNHIFYKYLKSAKAERKVEHFETFQELLRFINLDKLTSSRNQLLDYDHPVGDFDILLEYLYTIRNNSSKFVSILRNQLQ